MSRHSLFHRFQLRSSLVLNHSFLVTSMWKCFKTSCIQPLSLCSKPYFHFDNYSLDTGALWTWLGSMIDFWLEFPKSPWLFPSEISSIFHSPKTTHFHSQGWDYLVIKKCSNGLIIWLLDICYSLDCCDTKHMWIVP